MIRVTEEEIREGLALLQRKLAAANGPGSKAYERRMRKNAAQRRYRARRKMSGIQLSLDLSTKLP